MNKTEQVIVGMLTENTGSHFLDSGGAYGRHWSRNQTRNFAAEPKVRAHFCSYLRESGERLLELQAHISLYHWMKENLEFDAEMQARLDAYAEEQPACESWHSIAEGFAEAEQERLCDASGAEARGYPKTCNTYNETDYWDLDQVLEFRELSEDGYSTTHLVLQVHNGCDVRGGYTAPKCFRVLGDWYEWSDSAGLNGLSAGDLYWEYDRGSCFNADRLADSSRENDGKGPKNILDLPVFESAEEMRAAHGESADPDWWVLVPGDGTAWLNGPHFQEQVEVWAWA